jgi:hypothetical protein
MHTKSLFTGGTVPPDQLLEREMRLEEGERGEMQGKGEAEV